MIIIMKFHEWFNKTAQVTLMNNLFSKNYINKTKNTKILIVNNIKQEEQNFWLMYNFGKHLLQERLKTTSKRENYFFIKCSFKICKEDKYKQ